MPQAITMFNIIKFYALADTYVNSLYPVRPLFPLRVAPNENETNVSKSALFLL